MSMMFDFTIPVLTRGLCQLSHYVDLAVSFSVHEGLAPSKLMGARLAPDMMPLSAQVQRASDNAKSGAARLAGIQAPAFADNESSFEELKHRIARTVENLASYTPAQFEGARDRSVALNLQAISGTMTGYVYLTQFLMPNFFFHIATVHAILRMNGLDVGKRDYLGALD